MMVNNMFEDIKTAAFIAGHTELYSVARDYPDLRMVPIESVELVRRQLRSLGYTARIRYCGPHQQTRDTLKRNARAYTVYLEVDQ